MTSRSDGLGRKPESAASLAQEVVLIQKNAHFGASTQFAQARLWRLIGNFLIVPAAVLAAVAGGIALSRPSAGALSGTLSLAAASLAAIQAALNPTRKELIAQNCANSALEVRNAARQLLVLEINQLSHERAMEKVRELTARINEIHRMADPPSSIAWRLGQRRARKTVAIFVRDVDLAREQGALDGTTP